MTDEATGAPPAEQAVDIPAHSTAGDGPLTEREAARSLIDWRRKRAAGEERAETDNSQVERQDEAAPAQESEVAQATDDAAPQVEATGETQAIDPAEEVQPLELPRSWTKDQSEYWNKLDRATQEYLLEHDRKSSAEVRRVQNEAAEQRKAAEAERQKAEQVRLQFENAIPALMQAMQQQQAGEFGDIQTMADVERLSKEDPLRFNQWQAAQMKIAAARQMQEASQKRQAEAFVQAWEQYSKKEDAAFIEKVPEFADPEKRSKMSSEAVDMLRDIGFTDQEMADAYAGKYGVSLRDHRLHLMFLDALKYRQAQKAAKVAVKKPVPQVQRPGVAPARNAGAQERIANLTKQLENASGNNAMRIAAERLKARRAAAS